MTAPERTLSAYAITNRHDHAADVDTGSPAAFFGEHTHTFEESDDHYHEDAAGSGTGTSPHDLHDFGDLCSPCGYGFNDRTHLTRGHGYAITTAAKMTDEQARQAHDAAHDGSLLDGRRATRREFFHAPM